VACGSWMEPGCSTWKGVGFSHVRAATGLGARGTGMSQGRAAYMVVHSTESSLENYFLQPRFFQKENSSYRSILWDITPCIPLKVNRHFGIIYRLHVQGLRISQASSVCYLRHAGFVIGLFFDPDNGIVIFLRNAG
jgi:hypothetical protein